MRIKTGEKLSKEIVNRGDFLFICLLAGVVLVHLSRIRLGMVEPDESFYLAIPLRFVQGDALLVDEWNMGQTFSVLLYPLLKIYLAVVGNTEGIYLAFRYIWLVCSIITSVISYMLLRRKSKYIGAAASIMISLFTYACIRALSYNTMITMAVWLFVVVSVTEIQYYRMKYTIMGLLLAIIILCNPYMMLFYVGYAVFCLIKKEKDFGYYSPRALFYVTLGSVAVAIFLLFFLFSRASIFEVLDNLSGVFYNPSHQWKTVEGFFDPIIKFVVWFKLYFICYIIGNICLIVGNEFVKKLAFSGLAILSFGLWFLLLLFKAEGIGRFAIYLPLTMMGLSAFLNMRNKDWIIFGRGWITGIVLACCMNMASNQGIYAILDACCISAGVSLFLIDGYLEENEVRFGKIWVILFATIQIFAQVWINLNSVFWADDISELKYEIESGPAKGIITSEDKKKNYEINCNNIKELGDLTGKNIMIFNYFSIGYMLVPEARCGAFSPWMTEYPTPDDEQFIRYYRLHPDRIPDVVYFDIESGCDWTQKDWENWCENNEIEL